MSEKPTPWTPEEWALAHAYTEQAEAAVATIMSDHIWSDADGRCACRENFNPNSQIWHVARMVTKFDICVDAPPLCAPEWMRPVAVTA